MLEGVAALLFAACNLFAGTDAGVLKVCESVALVPQPTRRSTKKPKVNRRSHFIDWLNTTLLPPLSRFLSQPGAMCDVNASESKAHP